MTALAKVCTPTQLADALTQAMRYHFLGSILCGLALILLTAATGYSDAVDPRNVQEDAATTAGDLTAARIGQTFVAHQSRLHALEVRWIVPDDFHPVAGSRITLHLRHSPADDRDLATASIPLAELRNNQFGKFVFPALPESDGRSFYFFFEIAPAGMEHGFLSPWASDEDAYPDGQMSVNGLPADRDLVFRAYYEPDLPMLLGALREMFGHYAGAILFALLLLFIPGMLLVPLHQMLTVPLALGTGLAALSAFSLLLLFFRIDHPLLLALVAALLLASVVVRWRLASRTSMPGGLTPALLWLVPAVLSLCVGFLQIRDLAVPLWVDSFAHAQWIQVLLSEGRLPASNFYHFGYHALTAIVTRLAGLTIPQAMLLMGPLLITQTGLGVFLLSWRLTGSLAAGLVSGICIWFLSPTPSYFTTWGRYPLLMASALLPIALFWVMDWIDQPHFHFPTLAGAVLAFAGLAFAQVRLTIFYFAFVGIYVLYVLYRSPDRNCVSLLWRLVALLLLAIGVGLMWLASVFLRGVEPQALLAENAAGPSIDITTAIAVSLQHHGPELILLSLLSAAIGLVRRSKTTILALVWYGTLYLIALLPRTEWGGALISPDLVVLMSFMPVALMIGDLLSYLYIRLGGALDVKNQITWGITGALVILSGALDLVSIINPATVQFSSVDMEAMEWIRGQTPRQATFLINSFNWYDTAFVPSDGGAWIPFLTGRAVDYFDDASALPPSDPEQMAQWIAARRIGYVYLGRRSGVLHRSDVASRPDRYALVYRQGGVEIWQVRAPGARALPTAAPTDGRARGKLSVLDHEDDLTGWINSRLAGHQARRITVSHLFVYSREECYTAVPVRWATGRQHSLQRMQPEILLC